LRIHFVYTFLYEPIVNYEELSVWRICEGIRRFR